MERNGKADGENGIVIRDRRKPNQYTTDNVIAREWLPILRVGDAFFFYSVYLSMANRETESSWGSLRTLAQYLQCGVDLIIRGNKLLEICELIYIEPGNQYTANEYYILDPPSFTPELAARISARLDEIEAQETGKNWQAWVKQVRAALENHVSLPQIWAQRRANRGGRPLKTARAENPVRDSQTPFSEKGVCEPQAGCACSTNRVVVAHEQGDREAQAEQEELTSRINKVNQEQDADILPGVLARCQILGVAPTVLEVLLEKYQPAALDRQLVWLPARHPRDPAAMFVRSVQENWAEPPQFDPEQSAQVWAQWQAEAMPCGSEAGQTHRVDAAEELWQRVLLELEMQMTRATFDQWLRGTRALKLEAERIVVQVRDVYAREWIERRLAQTVIRTVQDIAGCKIMVSFVTQDEVQGVGDVPGST